MTDTKTRNINPRPTLNIPLPAELKARFRDYCEAHGLAPAKVLRLHIQKLLDEASRKEG